MLAELWSDARYRLRSVFRRAEIEAEMDEELRFHLDREAEKLVAAGVEPAEAKRRAALVFGGLHRTKDETRDAHGTALLDQFLQDLRYAARGFRARPLFTAVVIATLGLGVGVNAAMFSVIDRAMFRPAPYLRDPGSVHRVFVSWSGPDGDRTPQHALEYARFQDLARWSRASATVAGFGYRDLPVGEGDAARERTVGVFSASFLDLFDAKPVLGRFFTATEDALPSGAPVAVLAHSYWQSQLGGRGDVLGSTVRIGRGTFTVIGVAPKGFVGIIDGRSPDIFIPITAYASLQTRNFYQGYGWSWMDVVVRGAPGASVDALSADLSSAFRRSWKAEEALVPNLPTAETVKPEVIVAPTQLARGPSGGADARVLVWVSGVAVIVLLVACANVANLLLARALRRRRELAVRRALGGSRGRLVRQLLTETLLLALIGGAAGLVGAQLAAGALRRIFSPESEGFSVLSDARTLAFAFVVTAVTAFLAGIIPAVHSGGEDLAGTLRGGMRDGAYRGRRARRVLLVFQTALSVILLVGAGLFTRSLHGVRSARLGFDADRLVYVAMNLRGTKLADAERVQLADRVLAEARAIPGVERASFTMSVPFWSFEGRGLFVPGVDSVRKLGQFLLQAGSTDYFATTGTRILRGRGFSDADRAAAPSVAVVSEAMARVLWKRDDPIGKRFRVGSDTAQWTTVVGVAENVRAEKITDGDEFAYYLPIDQYRAMFGADLPFLYVRVRGNPDDQAEAVRARLQRVMPGAGYVSTVPLHEMVDPAMRSWTSGATMFSALGGLALTLASIGLYAVIAFGVAQRMNELGVRIALGALPRDVMRLVVGEGIRITLVGVGIGAAVALAGARGVEPLLYGVTGRDPLVYAAVTVLLVAVGGLASALPAARAARLDPNLALRCE